MFESYLFEDMFVSFVPSPVSAPQRQRVGSKGTEYNGDIGWLDDNRQRWRRKEFTEIWRLALTRKLQNEEVEF